MRLRGRGWRRYLMSLLPGRSPRPEPAPGEGTAPLPGLRWFDSREDYRLHLEPGHAERRAREREIARGTTWPGVCTYCRAPRDFVVSAGVFSGESLNLREGLVCPVCGLGNRLRLLFRSVEEFAGSPEALRKKRAYAVERVTGFYDRLSARIDDLVGSEFLDPKLRSGETGRLGPHLVRHEDLLRLSFPDESFDLVIHADVLEHVPDFRRAFAELFRVTRRGGGMFFSVPFLHERAEDEVRATVEPDGTIVHHLPAAYHGNPVDPKGSLAYRTYGWSLLHTLKSVGFDTAQAGVLVDLERGFTSSNSDYADYMEPVVFRALRRA